MIRTYFLASLKRDSPFKIQEDLGMGIIIIIIIIIIITFILIQEKGFTESLLN